MQNTTPKFVKLIKRQMTDQNRQKTTVVGELKYRAIKIFILKHKRVKIKNLEMYRRKIVYMLDM